VLIQLPVPKRAQLSLTATANRGALAVRSRLLLP
jgi:hypothetical protein